MWVDLSFRGPPGKVWFDQLFAQKDEIEAKFGHPLSWQRLDNKKQSRIAYTRENTDPTDEADWPAQHAWVADQLERFHSIFRPYALALTDGAGDQASVDPSAVSEEDDES